MIGLNFGINKVKRARILENNVTKKTKLNSKRINKYNGLKKKDEYILEKTCLEKLNSNFRCLCVKKSNHFPKICSSSNGILKLTNCGVSLNNYKKYLKNNEIDSIFIENKEEQVNCILHNLKKNNIKHLDMCLDGKNLCVSESGTLSLIDFNIACINNEYKTDEIKNRLNYYGMDNNQYDKYMKNRIMQVIKKCM